MSDNTIKLSKRTIANMKRKGVKRIAIDKAVKVLSDYRKNNFNGYKTLIENGYSELTALAKSGQVITSAKDRVAQTLKMTSNDLTEVTDRASSLYDVVGISREEVLKEYLSIMTQNINIAVKLRALEPLLKQEGVNWVEKEQDKTPTVVIKVDEVHNHSQLVEETESFVDKTETPIQ